MQDRTETVSHSDEFKVSEVYPELFHYTDRAGLEGIWRSGTLHATRYDCLNDRSEVEHFREGLVHAVTDALKAELIARGRNSFKLRRILSSGGGAPRVAQECASGFVAALYQVTFQESTLGSGFAVPFIVSFCSHGSDHKYEQEHGLLSQWRGYGGAERYALVFESKGLEFLLDDESNRYFYSHLQFSDVVYNDDQLDFKKSYAGLITLITETCWRLCGEPDVKPNLENLFTPFVTAATRLKHRGFKEEREVRIIACPQSSTFLQNMHQKIGIPMLHDKEAKQFHVRQRPNGSEAPYIRLFWRDKSQSLPITRIIVGPHRDQAKLAAEVRQVVGTGVRIVVSQTPFVG
jgi:hypothetical protein